MLFFLWAAVSKCKNHLSFSNFHTLLVRYILFLINNDYWLHIEILHVTDCKIYYVYNHNISENTYNWCNIIWDKVKKHFDCSYFMYINLHRCLKIYLKITRILLENIRCLIHFPVSTYFIYLLYGTILL